MHNSLWVLCSSRRVQSQARQNGHKKCSFSSDVLGQLKGGESRGQQVDGWVAEEMEGEGLCLQMFLVWMQDLHRNVSERSVRVENVALRDRWQGVCRGKTKKRERRRRESKQLQTMALACLGLGCVPVRSKGTVCNTSVFLKTCYYLLAVPVFFLTMLHYFEWRQEYDCSVTVMMVSSFIFFNESLLDHCLCTLHSCWSDFFLYSDWNNEWWKAQSEHLHRTFRAEMISQLIDQFMDRKLIY